MAIILAGKSCHDCELLFWKIKHSTNWLNASRIEESSQLLDEASVPSKGEMRGLMSDSWILESLPKPVSVIVSTRERFRANMLIESHASCRNPPPRSFIRIGEGLYACSPEFRILQASKQLSLAAQCVFALELCGTYLLDSKSEDGFVKSLPRTTPELFGSYLEGSEGAYGAKRAHRILAYLEPGSHSPMESVMYTVMRFHSRCGGYRLRDLKFNVPIETSPDFPYSGVSETRKCDIYLPDIQLDVEFNGNLRHSGAKKKDADDHRRLMLENAGVNVITLAYEDASNVATMNRTVERIKSLRGIKYQCPSPGTLDARNKLFASIMPGRYTPCNPYVEIQRFESYRRFATEPAVAKRR